LQEGLSIAGEKKEAKVEEKAVPVKELLRSLEKIQQLLDTFKDEELGNRLSQFSILALKSLIEKELLELIDRR